MNRDELLFDKIEAYLQGKMSPADASAFEAEIDADAELAALVKTHRLEREGLEWLVERDLLTKMDAWEREVGRDGTIVNRPAPSPSLRIAFVRRWRWAVGVAAVLVLGVFGWWLLQPQEDIGGPQPIVTAPKPKKPATAPPEKAPKPSQKPSASPKEEDDRVAGQAEPSKTAPAPQPETRPTSPAKPAQPDYPAIAATFYREQDFIQKNGNTAGGEPAGYGQALDSYKSGKYSDVEKLLKPALKNDPNALKTKELLAHSLYRRGQYAEALTYFRQLAGVQDKTIAERSEWAMALTLLHQMPARKTLLDRTLDRIIAQPDHAFHGKAKELKRRVGE